MCTAHRCSRSARSASTRAPRPSTKSTSCSEGERSNLRASVEASLVRARSAQARGADSSVRSDGAVHTLALFGGEFVITAHAIYVLGSLRRPSTGCLIWQVPIFWLFTMLHQMMELFVAVTIGYTFRAQPFNVLFQQAREPTVCIASPPRSSAVVVASAALVLAGAAGGDRARRADVAVDHHHPAQARGAAAMSRPRPRRDASSAISSEPRRCSLVAASLRGGRTWSSTARRRRRWSCSTPATRRWQPTPRRRGRAARSARQPPPRDSNRSS